MPQGTNSTMCVGQAKHYQLCQQQVRTTSSPDWSSLGGVGLGGSHLELQITSTRGGTGPSEDGDKGYDALLGWWAACL